MKALEEVKPGDLVLVEWLDASRGKLQTNVELREMGTARAVNDSPVKTYGVFIGLFGKKSQHIVTVASFWAFTSVADYGQVDTMIVPIGCVEKVEVLHRAVLDVSQVNLCQTAFIEGRCHHYMRRFQIKGRRFEVTHHYA